MHESDGARHRCRAYVARAALAFGDVRQGAVVALQTDHYELTMVASALRSGVAHHRSVFEAFCRRLPSGRAYGVVSGIDRVIEAIESFRFSEATVDHLVDAQVVSDPEMIDWLLSYRFSGDVVGYPDGELFFPYSPILTVEGSFAECVVLETVVLSILNHDCAVAAAASRVRDVAPERLLIEGGGRRTDPDAAVAAALAAHIGGFDTTSNLEAGRRYGIPTAGTTAHAFVLAHTDERSSFRAQERVLGAGSTYLVDTFDVLQGVRRAVEAAGTGIGAVRIDSGDLLEVSIATRALLDSLGAHGCRIIASSDLDEFRVARLEAAAAPIDAYLAGTSIVTGSGHPAASIVYKLVSIADSTEPSAPLRAVGKLSPGKVTFGGSKLVHRSTDRGGHWEAELLSPRSPESAVTPAQDAFVPQVKLISHGERAWAESPTESRHRCQKRRRLLRPEDRLPHPSRTPAIPTRWLDFETPAPSGDSTPGDSTPGDSTSVASTSQSRT